ncbi:MAG: tyrosine-type recombinase/integrase [Candidatus Bathyarchaeia archaeon]
MRLDFSSEGFGMAVSHNATNFISGETTGEFVSQNEPQQSSRPRKCPQCGSSLLYKDGLRQLSDGSQTQRYLCRACGLRFSFGHKKIKTIKDRERGGQVCVSWPGTKNLTSATIVKVAGDKEGILAQFEWKCLKRGLQPSTIKLRIQHLAQLMRDGADLNTSETVETVLAVKNYPTPTKWLLVQSYKSYCKLFGIQWEPIKVNYEPKMPYIPTEQDCFLFIAGLSKRLGIFCRALLETGCRRGEAHKLEWTDINFESCKIAITHPEKGSLPRYGLRVSRTLIDLLNSLPRKYDTYVFNPKNGVYCQEFHIQRKRVADKNVRPSFIKIHFHTFRHVRATTDILNGISALEVQHNLGHKHFSNTEKYLHWTEQLRPQQDERFYFASVATDEEAGKLIESGWTYICNNPNTNRMLFRKAK